MCGATEDRRTVCVAHTAHTGKPKKRKVDKCYRICFSLFTLAKTKQQFTRNSRQKGQSKNRRIANGADSICWGRLTIHKLRTVRPNKIGHFIVSSICFLIVVFSDFFAVVTPQVFSSIFGHPERHTVFDCSGGTKNRRNLMEYDWPTHVSCIWIVLESMRLQSFALADTWKISKNVD